MSSVRVVKFWTEYKQNPDGTPREVDMVEYCGVGQAQYSTTRDTVSRISKVRPVDPMSEDEAAKMANLRWAAIEPAYRAWKSGQELPVNGTPLGAWPALTPEKADVLRSCGIRAVEELAEATETVINRIKLPGARDLKAQAALFLASFDKQATANRISAAEQENAALKADLEEMRQLLLEMQAAKEDKPRRGRPPKAEAEEEAA